MCFCVFRVVLRVRAVFHKTVRVCYVYCNFKIGFTCRIIVNFGTLKDGNLLNNTLASSLVLATETCSKMASTLCQKQLTPFCQKAQNFIQFGLSDNVQILLACGTNTYKAITNDISDFRCQHMQRQYEIPYRNINFSHLILRSSSFMFPLLLITVEVKNTICNSLITMFMTSWRNLIKIG